jgi:putative flippase GtrA
MMRVGVGGVLATTVDFIAMILLHEYTGMAVGLAAFLGAAFGGVTSYCISKFWAFRDSTPIGTKQLATYALVSFVTASLVGPTVQLLHNFGIHYTIGKIIAAIAVFFCWGYPAQSRIVFRRARFARQPQLAD